ncbi:MAG: flippase [Thiohalomonadaceae bacterium]
MLIRQSIATGLSLVFQVAAAFLANVLVARLLVPTDYGVYAFWVALATLVVVPASAGLPQLLVRELAAYRELKHLARGQGLLLWAARVTIAITCTVVLLGLLATHAIPDGNVYVEGMVPLLALCSIPFLAFNLVRAGAMSGLGAVVLGGVPERIIRPLVFLLGVVALSLVVKTATTTHVLAMHLCAAVVAFIAGVLWLKRRAFAILGEAGPQFAGTHWLSAAMPLAFIATVQMLIKQADVVLMGFLAGAEDVAIYQVAARVALLVGFVQLVYTTILSPQVARLWAAGEHDAIRKTVAGGTALATLVTTILVVGLSLLGEEFLLLVFGEAYAAAHPILVVLLLGQWVNTFFGPVGLLLNMTRHLRPTVNAMVMTAVVNITLNIVLVKQLGAIGAAYSALASYVFFNGILYVQCKRILNIDPSALGLAALPFPRQA